MRVTMRDIAEKCGVSRPTVNLILNDRGAAYSEETRRRVLAAAKELGYRRNGSARAIQSGRFYGVGLLLSPTHQLGGIPAGFLTRVERDAALHGYHLTIGHVPSVDPKSSSRLLPKFLTEALVDGLIVYGSHELPAELRQLVLSQPGTPAVWVGDPHEVNSVWPDETKACRELIERLVELGHRDIAFVGPVHWTNYSLVARRDAYHATMKELELPAQAVNFRPLVDYSTMTREQRLDIADSMLQSTAEWLRSSRRPSAVIAYDRDDAMMIQTAAYRIGWSLPEDLSLATFDDFIVNASGQPISGMMIATNHIGAEALKMLLHRIETRGESLPGKPISYNWMPGRTVGAPPSTAFGRVPGSASRGNL